MFEPNCRPGGRASSDGSAAFYDGPEGLVAERSGNSPRGGLSTHIAAHRLKEHLGDEIWNSYFKFCGIRNPFDKVVSWFWHQVDKGFVSLPDHRDETVIATFRDWLGAEGRIGRDRKVYAINRVYCMDDVIRYETLTQDVSRIARKLGVVETALPTHHSGIRASRLPFGQYYCPKTAEIVTRRFAFEFRTFGYAPEGWRLSRVV